MGNIYVNVPLQSVSSCNLMHSSKVLTSPLPITGQLTLSTIVFNNSLFISPVNCEGVLAWTVKKLTPAFSSCLQTSIVFLNNK